MAVTLVLPNGQEVHSAATPYVTTEARAREAQARGQGQATTNAAHAAADALALELAWAAPPEALAKALGVVLPADAEERHRVLVDLARQAQGRPLTRDPLALLHRRGSLPNESFRAGQEIARVFMAISAGVTPRVVASYGERAPSGPAMEDWPVTLRTAYRDRYVPWRAWAGSQPVRKRGSRETLGDLVLLVAGEGHCVEVVAVQLRMDKRTVLRRLQDALWCYAVRAGWGRETATENAA